VESKGVVVKRKSLRTFKKDHGSQDYNMGTLGLEGQESELGV
jgi:hypothetical protein